MMGDYHVRFRERLGVQLPLATRHSFLPFKDKSKSLDVQALYQQLSTRVEVNGIGDDQWKFGALNLTVAMSF
jgi:hypothetical protein